jgi:hypothetical protein
MIDDYTEENYTKYLTIGKVKELLMELDDNFIVACNQHKNLQIYHGETKESLGFIDFAGTGSIENLFGSTLNGED